jgi:hypothetical protein
VALIGLGGSASPSHHCGKISETSILYDPPSSPEGRHNVERNTVLETAQRSLVGEHEASTPGSTGVPPAPRANHFTAISVHRVCDGPREIRGRNILFYSSPHASQTSNLPDLVIDSVQVPLWKWWMRTKSKGQD